MSCCLGLLLIGLPSGAALCNLVTASDIKEEAVENQLVCGYIIMTVIFAHCNFSQLACWPKTVLATVFGAVLIVLTQICVAPTYKCHVSANSSLSPTSLPTTAADSFNALLFAATDNYRWEIIVDVLLALLLIGFLNYQFEASFRMSFYGDRQARQDMSQMQAMQNQADWLLSNIIPHFVIEDLKSNTKYSENHKEVAVLFASIVNWNEMYEENFEGAFCRYR